MPCRRARYRHQAGMALVVALLVFALCAALLVGLQGDFDRMYRRTANSFVAEQSWEYLLGAEELAALALQLDHDTDLAREGPPRDDLTEIWAQEATPYALDEGGWMRGQLEDLQGRFNLNNLGEAARNGDGTSRYGPWQRAFIRLLQALDGAEVDEFQAVAITESVADWVDADDLPRLNGAESSYYVSLTPSYRPANRSLRSVSELRAVANMTSDIYRALRPLVSVWPDSGAQINVHTARIPVLRALNTDESLQPLSLDAARELARRRGEDGFETLQDFLAAPAFAAGNTDSLNGMLTESSSYFLLTSRVEIADREQQLYSVLQRQGREVSVLQRSNVNLFDSIFETLYQGPGGPSGTAEPLTESAR